MKDEITIPLLKEEDLITAAERRRKYSLARDLKAAEYNEAIALRMAKDKEEQELNQNQNEDSNSDK